jgi:hypothetical protein
MTTGIACIDWSLRLPLPILSVRRVLNLRKKVEFARCALMPSPENRPPIRLSRGPGLLFWGIGDPDEKRDDSRGRLFGVVLSG